MKPRPPSNPQNLADLMVMAVDFAGLSLRSGRQIPPTLLAVTKKGPLFFTPASLQDDRSKDDFADTARLICIAYQVPAAVLILESWMKMVINAEGKLLLREPKNHYDGYVWTFPKGKPEPGETEVEAALREVWEETGVVGCIAKRIPGEFQGGTSKTIYFLMTVERETGELDDETQSVAWVTADAAVKRIQQTTNQIGRKRDLAVLKAALALIG